MSRHSHTSYRTKPEAEKSGFRKWLRGYLVTAGILAHIAAPLALYFVSKESDKSFAQHYATVVDAVKKKTYAGVTGTRDSRRDYASVEMTGSVRDTHPRLILPQLANWQGGQVSAYMEKRLADLHLAGVVVNKDCNSKNAFQLLACWLTTGKGEAADKVIAMFRSLSVIDPQASGNYGNGWEFALVYDLAFNNPGFSKLDKKFFEALIEDSLGKTIRLLDSDGPSLWHGRSTLAANAWILATVLDGSSPEQRLLIRKAHGHFMSIIEALEFSEAWPEGYNYWINTRAFPLMLAMSAYVNGMQNGSATPRIKAIMTRLGLWTIYATRPDNRFEGDGDEGPRVDLKDETQRIIDMIAAVTRKPVFAAFSRYLSHLHKQEAYYWGYRWGIPLFTDGDMAITTLGKKITSMEDVAKDLPLAAEFGPGSMGLAYLRSGWKADDTFISFISGHAMVHHGHYGAGGFTLFKNAPLAINSSLYGGFKTPNRLNYSIRSVAKNTLLIMRPDEDIRPNRFFVENVVDGGQRLIMPTGSTIINLDHWRKNLDAGAHYRAGEITGTDFEDSRYTYLKSNIAPAYDTPEFDLQGDDGRVSELTRELFYLREEDRLIVHDVVKTVDASFKKKWLLHTINKPIVTNAKVLQGDSDNGILETEERFIQVENANAELDVQIIYPLDAVARLVGGTGYEYYVENDAEESVLDGKNYIEGASAEDWFDVGRWRIEVQPKGERNLDHFLIALSPHLKGNDVGKVRPLSIEGRGYRALQTPDSVVIFMDKKASLPLKFKLQGRQTRVYVVGVPAGKTINLDAIGLKSKAVASKAGVASLELFAPPLATVRIRW